MAVKLTDRASIPAVLAAMTLEEKATLVTGATSFGTAPIERLGIPAALFIDAGGGVNLRQYLANLLSQGQLQQPGGPSGNMESLSQLVYIMDHLEERDALSPEERELLDRFLAYLQELVPCGDLPSCFPVNSLLASTFDPDVVLRCARQVGQEASAFGVDMLLGTPCINIQRDPRGGRGFEGYSEDPYLVSRLAPNYARGVQEQGVLADVKHFAANNQETERQSIDERISERTLREIYLPAFRACVQEGGVKNVMTAYNYINGQACAHNRWLLEDVLRGEWGFTGFVVSDWGGVYDQVAALQAGNDLCMPGPRDISPILRAVEDGVLPLERLDASVQRILEALVEMPVMRGRKARDIDSKAARQVAYDAAAEGIILLKNNGVLPLAPTARVALYGHWNRRFLESGIGSGRVHTNKTSSLRDCVASIAGADHVLENEADDATDVIIVTVAAHGQEGADRESLSLDAPERAVLEQAKADAQRFGCRLVVLLNVAGPVELEDDLPRLDAVVCLYFPGQEGAHATADLLYGKINPSGKLAQTFPRHLYDVPAYYNFPGENKAVAYGEGIFVGYRHYDARHIEPLFPFGFGLSYTTFALSDPALRSETFRFDRDPWVEVSVTLRNTGTRRGKEVVQLYVSDEQSTLQRPLRELKGFAKVELAPGEARRITLRLTAEDLSFYDEQLGRWVLEPGWFTLYLGTSSRDLPLRLRLRADGPNPYAYGPGSQFAPMARDPRARAVILDVMPKGTLAETQLARMTAYVAFSFTLQQAWEQKFRPLLTGCTPAEQEVIYREMCARLAEIDVTDQKAAYRETHIF